MMLLLGTLVRVSTTAARPFMTFRPLAYIGAVSYGMYVYHMWVIHPVRIGFTRLGWPNPTFGFFLAALACSTVVAGLSYRFIEEPLLRLKARFASDAGAAAPEPESRTAGLGRFSGRGWTRLVTATSWAGLFACKAVDLALPASIHGAPVLEVIYSHETGKRSMRQVAALALTGKPG